MIELRELLSRLQGVEEKGGGQFIGSAAPAHDDKRASLAVRMGEKGIVLNLSGPLRDGGHFRRAGTQLGGRDVAGALANGQGERRRVLNAKR